MYIDGVIIYSLAVIAMIIWMMVFIYRYAKKHIAMDAKKAKKLSKESQFKQAYK